MIFKIPYCTRSDIVIKKEYMNSVFSGQFLYRKKFHFRKLLSNCIFYLKVVVCSRTAMKPLIYNNFRLQTPVVLPMNLLASKVILTSIRLAEWYLKIDNNIAGTKFRYILILLSNKPLFLRVCSTSFLKTHREKEKSLVTSNFFLSP